MYYLGIETWSFSTNLEAVSTLSGLIQPKSLRIERGYGVLSFDEPAEGEEGGASENGSAPSVRVPFTVLPNGIPPLIPQSGRVRNLFLWRVEMHLLLPWKLFWAIITGTGNPTRRRVMGFGVILSHVAVAGSIVFT